MIGVGQKRTGPPNSSGFFGRRKRRFPLVAGSPPVAPTLTPEPLRGPRDSRECQTQVSADPTPVNTLLHSRNEP
jgi:hypothetical protein